MAKFLELDVDDEVVGNHVVDAAKSIKHITISLPAL